MFLVYCKDHRNLLGFIWRYFDSQQIPSLYLHRISVLKFLQDPFFQVSHKKVAYGEAILVPAAVSLSCLK